MCLYEKIQIRLGWKKLISFGSGAEIGYPSDPYGLSKNIINRIIKEESNFFNIRIYGVFDENELDTRFIKNNIKRYINKQPLEIHENKYMDFFYMKDLITVTDRAVSQIKKIMKEADEEVLGVVIGVDKTGCSGYAYKLDYVKNENNTSN